MHNSFRRVWKIANRKKLTSDELTVLLHEEGGIAKLANGMLSIVEELREFRKGALPLLTQSKDIAEIKATA